MMCIADGKYDHETIVIIQFLYNKPHYNTDLDNKVVLWPPIFLNGNLQKNYRKMTIKWSFPYHSFVKLSNDHEMVIFL